MHTPAEPFHLLKFAPMGASPAPTFQMTAEVTCTGWACPCPARLPPCPARPFPDDVDTTFCHEHRLEFRLYYHLFAD